MSPERRKKIEEVFRTAFARSTAAERHRYLAEVCAGDSELRQEVERLLTREEGAETLLKELCDDASGSEAFAGLMKEDDPLVGTRLGAYQIISEIGSGGMGAVYLAKRADGAFRQHVAIKLVKRGMDTNFILRRFRQERQILAALNHPFITRLLDGGTTSDGLPYFVMEHIQGQPLYRYSDEQKLSVAERLQLFRQVCEAVAYAHHHNVIHRDLKPSNVLIKADGMPKLLDFGIAKVLNPELAADTIDPTATHMRLMTPEYASPEQVRGEAAAPASDIYALGVLLYELLTGHRPYRLKSRAPHEIARVICEEEPQRPSTGLIYEDNLVPTGTDEHRTLAYIYQARRSVSLAALQQELLGDLERIVLKALRKDPAERYQSATALADDITRYLEGKPVSAPAYARLSLLGSEPAAVRSLAVLPLRLLSSAASADTGDKYLSVGLADAIITRLSGIRSLAVRPTSAVLRYGNDAPDPFQAGRELAVDYALDGRIRIAGARIRVSLQLLDVASGISVWASQFDEQFVDILELEDSISAQVADALLPLLRADEQQQLNKRGTNNAAAFEAYLRGRFYWNTFTEEGFAKAIQYFQHAVSLAPDYALAYTGIADYYNFLGVYAVLPFAEASAKAKEAALKAVVLDNTLAESYSALGFAVLMHDFDWDLAGQHFRRAVELNPNYATGRLWYGSYLGLIGRFEEGFVQARQALNLDPLTPMVHHTMNWMLYYARRYEESLAGTRRLIATEPQYGMGYLFHCLVLSHTGQYSEAFAAGQRAIELLGRSPYTLVWLASAYAAAGQHEQAYALLEEIERMKAVRYVSPYLVAMIYSNLGEVEQAFAKLEEALAIRDARLLWLGVDPQFDRLRHDPRLHNLLRHTQNPLAAHTSVVAQEQAKPEKVTSLAVLPFKLLGAPTGSNTGDEYLGIGLADALISRLSKVQRFLLRPTSSVLCCGDCTDSFVAGRELKVDYVVDGTIRRVGERVRITAQLLNIGDISTRWAEQYNEKLTDVLELEDSIASQVAAALIPQLTGEERLRLEKRGTNSPAAYEAYLRGRYHWNQFTPDSLPKALAAFQKAVALDPNYALAQVGLADFYLWANIYGIIPSAEATPLAEAAAHRALQLDDRLGEAYASLGLVNSNRRNWAESERLYHQALELNPSYMHTHEWYAALLVGLGKFAAGIEEIKRAEQLDPLSLRTKTLVAWTLYQTQRFDDALAKGREIIDLDKNYPQGYAQIALNQLALGRAEDAVVNLQKFDVMIPNSALAKYQLCFALVAAGRQTAARTVLEEMKTLATSTYVKPFFLAMAHVALDERDTAFAYFEKSMAESEPWLLWLGTEPMLAGLHNDPRFLVLLNRANLSLVQ